MKQWLTAIWLIIIWGLTGFVFSVTSAAEIPKNPVLILADTSGSMQENILIQDEDKDENGKTERHTSITKAEALKALLLEITRQLPEMTCDTGIYEVRYLAGNKALYEPFLKIAAYEQSELTKRVQDDFVTDYPVFNRRTPLADMFHQLDEKELAGMDGNITLVLISDGKEGFYDIEADDETEGKKEKSVSNESDEVVPEKTEPEELKSEKSDKKNKGPIGEIRRLKEKYKDALILHTIFLGKPENQKEKTLLKNMAVEGEGSYFSGVQLLQTPSLIAELCALLCESEPDEVPATAVPPVTPEAPAPESEVVAASPVEPEPLVEEPECQLDTNGDGIADDDDKCPGTPSGAKVNPYGCWTLPGVLFAFDKWNIKPKFYPELDNVVRILTDNPDVKIEIQGHTDNYGSAAYNKRLSEKRAKSVKDYLIKKGINKERLSSAGYGFDKPTATNETPEGRQLNRRVELVVE